MKKPGKEARKDGDLLIATIEKTRRSPAPQEAAEGA